MDITIGIIKILGFLRWIEFLVGTGGLSLESLSDIFGNKTNFEPMNFCDNAVGFMMKY